MHQDFRLFNGLEKGVANGDITATDFGEYRLYKYSFECHMAQRWGEFTSEARGIICHVPTKSIVARPLKKFHNLSELESTKLENLPLDKPFYLQEKLDGSCIVTYLHGHSLATATPGSFISDQAKYANAWLHQHLILTQEEYLKGQHVNDPGYWPLNKFKADNKYLTFIFEAIYPENLNVVSYGSRNELVLLSVREHSGQELHPNRVDELAAFYKFSRPRVFDYSLDADLINKIPKDEEGYVAFWPELELRVKVKGETYVALHRIKSMFSQRGVCECLADGRYGDLYRILPQHLAKECDDIASLLRTKFYAFKHIAEDIYESVKNLPTRKEQALKIQNDPHREIYGVVFTMLDAQKKSIAPDIIDRMIWRVIYQGLEGKGKHV